jgi:hypothetical protein
MLQSFLNLCLVFRYRCPFTSVLLTHLLFQFCQQFLYSISNAKSLVLSNVVYFHLKSLSFVDQPYVNMNFIFCIVMGF